MPVETAGSLVGAGARALIKRGFALRAGASTRKRSRRCSPTFSTYYNAHIADRSRLFPGVEKALRAVRARGLAARRLHQQDRKLGQAFDRQARRRRPLRLRLRPGHVRRRQARSQAAAGDHPAAGGASQRAVMVGDSAPTSRPRARPDVASSPSISAIPTSRGGARSRTG